MNGTPTVAVLGGGASGTLVATQLARRLHPDGLRVVVVERRPWVGRGVAYSTPWEYHRLNVPAERMGAFPRDGGHFLRWARRALPDAGPGDFLPRGLYGEYLEAVLADAVLRARPGTEVVTLHDEAVAVEIDDGCARPCATLHLRAGEPVRADRLVIAIGNLPPALPPGADAALAASPRYHADPWDPGIPASASGEEEILLVGTGLTMIDVALTLATPQGPRRIRAVSRNGLLPRAHTAPRPAAALPYELPHGPFRLDDLVADVERRIAEAEAAAGDWRDVIDSLRPVTNRIWGRLNGADRERFVHDVSRHWEVRRHRMAPEVAGAVDVLMREGRLDVRAATIEALRPVPEGVRVAIAGEDPFIVDRVVNCTGPSLRMGAEDSPVLAGLLEAGHVRPGPFGLGLDHESRGALVTADGAPSQVVYGIGPVRKGRLWETTAIPEIRAQAFELADLFTAQLASRSAQAARAA
jgi:uncharacterized NAD(P)/FAD-binding protein YdhS